MIQATQIETQCQNTKINSEANYFPKMPVQKHLKYLPLKL